MKVIPVAGESGSGKTTFIRSLLPLLARKGSVGVVKHIGHHAMDLPEGKDTTVMFGEGAEVVAGIDREKTVLTLRSTSLAASLDILSGQGMAFAVVEGYKSGPWPKILIGDLKASGCVLRNPVPGKVITALDRFPDYFTSGELVRELAEECREEGRPCALATVSIPVPAGPGERGFSFLEKELPGFIEGIGDSSGIRGVQAAMSRGSLFGGTDEILIGVAAGTGEEAAAVIRKAGSRARKLLARR